MITEFKRPATPLAIFGLAVALGGVAGFVAARKAHGLDPGAVVMLGMAGGAGLATAVLVVDATWLVTGGLLLSVFSGNWGNLGIPLPLDRVVLVCGLGSAIARSLLNREERRIQVRGVHWLMLLLILYAVGSAAWSGTLTSHAPLFALIDRLGVVPFLLYLLAPVVFRTAHQRRVLTVGLVVLGAYLSLVTLFEALGLRSLVVPQYILNPALGIHSGRARGPFLEAGANGLALFVCAVATAVAIQWYRDRRVRVALLAIIALCVAGILYTLTRQTWLGAIGGTAVAMLSDPRLRRWLPAAAVTGAAIVAVSLVAVPGLSQSVSQRGASQAPIWDRLNSDAAALRMVESRPALGFGWGTFGSASAPYYRLASTYPLTSVGAAHNVPLSNASELGLVGLVLWALILVLAIGMPAARRAPPGLLSWRTALIAIAVAWFIQSNFTPFDYAFDNYIVWLWAGILGASAASGGGTIRAFRESRRGQGRRATAARLAGVGA